MVVLRLGVELLGRGRERRGRQLRADAVAVDGLVGSGAASRAKTFGLHGHLFVGPADPGFGALAPFSSRPRPPAALAVIFLGTVTFFVAFIPKLLPFSISYYDNGDVANLALDVGQRIPHGKPPEQARRTWNTSIGTRVEQRLRVENFFPA